MVTNRNKTIIAALIGADDLRVHQVNRDDELIQIIRGKELEFWQRILSREAPEPASPKDIKRLYQSDSGSVLEADDELIQLYANLSGAQSSIKKLEAEIETLSARIKARMGEAALLIHNGHKLAVWKKNKDRTITDWKALVHHHWPIPPAELVEQFTTIKSGSRPFLLK